VMLLDGNLLVALLTPPRSRGTVVRGRAAALRHLPDPQCALIRIALG
jgi:hypothetical protein